MTRHSRKPAIFALVLSFAAGITALAAAGQFRAPADSAGTIGSLERAIASGKNDAPTWAAYADALQHQRRFTHAAAAYARALAFPTGIDDLQKLRFNAALCLAQSGNAGQFFAFFTHLIATDPKLAVDILDRPEVAPLRADPRFSPAAANARAQAAD